ncbi:hypothetical protein EUTSA_v10009320mg [Eutrema salsugineum]|uniref:apyrase n=1 Tax=Eutrema salsugineum TaxID=72664 RepID=V4L6J8_EUTSA|nr:hypothetical protein EUTSA_v10009320mg [Eutrema salsugineum]
MTSETDPLIVQIQPDHDQSSPTESKSKWKPSKSIILLTFVSVAITLALFFAFRPRESSFERYSVVIDAGSSGTRAHVFRYWLESGKPVFDFGKDNYAKESENPGLSSYADNPKGANVSVAELVKFAKGRVPEGMWEKSDIRLMATAGLRLLNETVMEQILEVTREVLRSSGFNFRDDWAWVITGSDEGKYSWVVANYALGSLGGEPLQTTGIVELGGASAQVTFVSSQPMPEDLSQTITYGNVAYSLYSHSFLHLGQNAAHDKLWEALHNSAAHSTEDEIVTDPCTPEGYIFVSKRQNSTEESRLTASLQAAGNFTECRTATLAMLHEGKENCASEHCSIGSTFTPDLQGRFLATASFYYTSKFFELHEKDWLSEMIPAGKRFCGENWSELKVQYPTEQDKHLLNYCFSSAYIISMLHDSLGFALDDGRIEFASKAGAKDIPLDWALGAFILETSIATLDYSGKSRKMLG